MYLLGSPRLEIDGRIIALPTRKAFALLSYLAANEGFHQRNTLVTVFWPGSSSSSGRANLRNALSVIRKAVGSDILDTVQESVGIRPCKIHWIDALQFRKLVVSSRTEGERSGSRTISAPAAYNATKGMIDLLYRAVDLYKGPFLQGFGIPDSPMFDDWQRAFADSIDSLAHEAFEQLTRLLRLSAQYLQALDVARRWLFIDELNEQAHRELIRCYVALGKRDRALRQYERCREVLEKELGAAPDVTTISLYESIRVGKPNDECTGSDIDTGIETGDAVESLTRRFDLPRPPTSFVGRDGELSDLKHRISAGKLTTITGPGGCGKTRLAIEVAREVVGDYYDGVRFADIGMISSSSDVDAEVALAFGIRDQPDRPACELIVGYAADRELLLILDNCEHAAKQCATLVSILMEKCESLHILATSREPLAVPGEAIFRLEGLRCTGTDPGSPQSQARDSDAVRLFRDRARAMDRAFESSNENLRIVAKLCNRLEGLPLAIEIAAAHVQALSVEEILGLCDDHFYSLTKTDRIGSERHESLEKAFGWSYSLLTDEDRALFRRLSVFRGGFTARAAAEVCVAASEDGNTLKVIESLVSKSLVKIEKRSYRSRYRLLFPLRPFAADRMSEEPGNDRFKYEKRHRSWYASYAEEIRDGIRSRNQVAWLGRFEEERQNFRAAIHRSIEAGDFGPALRICGSLYWPWFCRGYSREGLELSELTVNRTLEADPKLVSRDLAGGLNALAYLCWWLERGENTRQRSQELARKAAEMYRDTGDEAGEAYATITLAYSFMPPRRSDELDSAREQWRRALDMFRSSHDPHGIAHCLKGSAIVELERLHPSGERRLEKAERDLLESVRICREIGDLIVLAKANCWLAGYEASHGKLAHAEARLRENLSICRKTGEFVDLGDSICRLAVFESRKSNHRKAVHMIRKGLELVYNADGNNLLVAHMLLLLANTTREIGLYARAARILGSAVAWNPYRLDDRERREHYEATLRNITQDARIADSWYAIFTGSGIARICGTDDCVVGLRASGRLRTRRYTFA